MYSNRYSNNKTIKMGLANRKHIRTQTSLYKCSVLQNRSGSKRDELKVSISQYTRSTSSWKCLLV